jgi:hypothetical protein
VGESVFDDTGSPRKIANINPLTGTFEIHGLFPGSYYISSSATVLGENSETSLRARLPIEIVNGDLTNVSLQLTPGWDLSGRLSVEGGSSTDANAASLARMRIRIRPDPSGPASPQASGTFVFRNMRAGDYRLWIDSLPAGGYLKSIRLGDADVLASGLHLEQSPSTPLEIVVSLKAGSITGSVVDSSGNTATNVVVALVPEASLRKRLDLYKNAFTDAGGRFRFENIAPGNYKLFVWSDVESGAWENAEFLSRYEETGKPVRIQEGDKQTAQLMLP